MKVSDVADPTPRAPGATDGFADPVLLADELAKLGDPAGPIMVLAFFHDSPRLDRGAVESAAGDCPDTASSAVAAGRHG